MPCLVFFLGDTSLTMTPCSVFTFFWFFLNSLGRPSRSRSNSRCHRCVPGGLGTMVWSWLQGGPIFSWVMRWWWWQRMIVGDNLVSPMNSPRLNPDANATALKPCRIFTTPHTCARSRRPWNGSLQSTDSQWNNRSH
jgi:hypothetical protein